MLFHEIYGSYFNVAAAVLREACANTLTGERLNEIIRERGFGESALVVPDALRRGDWPLLTPGMKTPLVHPPAMPLTLLQKRWMKALLSDPRIKLFRVSRDGLDDVEPLYARNVFHYFDRYNDGDPFEDEKYISHFHCVLTAIKEKRLLGISFTGRHGTQNRRVCFPWYLEYSSKDDKFRLIATDSLETWTINMGRIDSITVLNHPVREPVPPAVRKRSLVLELIDERNALDRAMLSFSHLEKEAVRTGQNSYRITLFYDMDGETELLIRVLSFGPMLRVVSPDSFISLIRERLEKQKGCGLK